MTTVTPSRATVISVLESVAQHGIASKGGASLLDVGSGPYIRFVKTELLDGLLANEGATFRVIEGAYGAGKTHMLQLISEAASERGMAIARADLSQGHSLDTPQLLTAYLLQNLHWSNSNGTFKSLPSVLDAMGRSGAVDPTRLDGSALPHAGFAKAMRLAAGGEFGRSSGTSLLRRFLGGEKVSVAEMRGAGIRGVKGPLTSRNAEQVLRTVLSGLHRLGCPGTVLLFDESERTFHVQGLNPSKKVRQAANLMRRLIDSFTSGDVQGALAVFAVLPGFTNDCARAYAALGQRLAQHRLKDGECGWRWPVLTIEQASGISDPTVFVSEAARRMAGLPAALNGSAPILEAKLRSEGLDVLRSNAGSGYRRQVMKRMAAITLENINIGGSRAG